MNTTTTQPDLTFDRMVEYAVLSNWDELGLQAVPLQIQVEYMPGNGEPVEFIKVWSSLKRGHWHLVCEYWTIARWGKSVGLNFLDSARSSSLASLLKSVIAHQSSFGSNSSAVGNGLVQVMAPTDPERRTAEACTSRFLQSWQRAAA